MVRQGSAMKLVTLQDVMKELSAYSTDRGGLRRFDRL